MKILSERFQVASPFSGRNGGCLTNLQRKMQIHRNVAAGKGSNDDHELDCIIHEDEEVHLLGDFPFWCG